MRTFKFARDPYDTGETLYQKATMTLEPGVTVLVGCNGTGKTTLLQYIKEKLDKEGLPVISYNNLIDGGSRSVSAAVFYDDMSLAANLLISSEGEQIITNLGTMANKIGRFVREHKGAPEFWILLDAIDSGLSVDNVIDVKECLFEAILNDNPATDVYIVVSANEYEMCSDENCFDVRNGKYVHFEDYDDYKKFILQSRKQKDARYKNKD